MYLNFSYDKAIPSAEEGKLFEGTSNIGCGGYVTWFITKEPAETELFTVKLEPGRYFMYFESSDGSNLDEIEKVIAKNIKQPFAKWQAEDDDYTVYYLFSDHKILIDEGDYDMTYPKIVDLYRNHTEDSYDYDENDVKITKKNASGYMGIEQVE